jgi:hypothetical protein
MAICLLKVLIHQEIPFLHNSIDWRTSEKELEEMKGFSLEEEL